MRNFLLVGRFLFPISSNRGFRGYFDAIIEALQRGGNMKPPPVMERYENLTSEEFAARIRAARAYLGLKLDEAGKALGISRQALSRRENNAVAIPTTDRFVMATVYCQLTGWPVEFFTDDTLPPIGLTSPGEGEGELGAGEVLDFVSEPPDTDALP